MTVYYAGIIPAMRPLFSIVVYILLLMSPQLSLAETGSYQIGVGDLLLVKVYDMPDLTTTDRVDSEGAINFPLIGKVAVADLSVQDVGQKIENALADGYLVNPQVSVLVQEYHRRTVVVIGAVNRPGLYELKEDLSLLELISKAGGLDNSAGKTITVTRKGNGDLEQKKIVLIDELLGKESAQANIKIIDKDTVYIEKAGLIYVTGEVNKPSAFAVDDETTVIKAITIAGGFSKLAAKGKVNIIRKVDGEERTFEKVPMSFLLQADDVIVVPESFF